MGGTFGHIETLGQNDQFDTLSLMGEELQNSQGSLEYAAHGVVFWFIASRTLP
jgi:hypothetical protein